MNEKTDFHISKSKAEEEADKQRRIEYLKSFKSVPAPDVTQLLTEQIKGWLKLINEFPPEYIAEQIAALTLRLVKDAGYVNLADDQTLPEFNRFLSVGEMWMQEKRDNQFKSAGWRKVEALK